MNIFRLYNIKVSIDIILYSIFITSLFFILCFSFYNYIEYKFYKRIQYLNTLEIIESQNYIYKPNRLDFKEYIYYYIVQLGSIDDYIEIEKVNN